MVAQPIDRSHAPAHGVVEHLVPELREVAAANTGQWLSPKRGANMPDTAKHP
jgi:hypothetical protein